MKTKQLIAIVACSVILYSCDQQKSVADQQELTDKEAVMIQDEINERMSVVIEGIKTNEFDKIFGDFWQSDSCTFMLNGVMLKGYDQIAEAFRQGEAVRQNLDFQIRSEEIVVLDRNAAMHLAEFTNRVGMANDSVSNEAGNWTAVFKKINDRWKVVHVHESYNVIQD